MQSRTRVKAKPTNVTKCERIGVSDEHGLLADQAQRLDGESTTAMACPLMKAAAPRFCSSFFASVLTGGRDRQRAAAAAEDRAALPVRGSRDGLVNDTRSRGANRSTTCSGASRKIWRRSSAAGG